MAAYILHLTILAGIFIILAVSLNLIIGYAGQVSLGHAAFYGIGAYASTLTAMNLHFPYPLAVLAAMVFTGHRHPRLRGHHRPVYAQPGHHRGP
jgi:branched-chain amino acid transport system permease protein